ncbi:MAG: helix-turn-helix domain-containing protein, partial [Streptosporangiales bacterium]|nr:helix-turn-helix domain-containing protein [Streptosporangiales bacterium]
RLSQAQLAGSDLSDSYVSLIESGKRVPGPTVVRMLADKLGCSPQFLVDGVEQQDLSKAALRTRYAELALREGNPAQALVEFTALLGDEHGTELHDRVRMGRAEALRQVGRHAEAIAELEGLREIAEKHPERFPGLPVTIALSHCHQAAGDLARAQELGEQALAHAETLGLTGGTELLELGCVLGAAYGERGNTEAARHIGERILARTADASAQDESVMYAAASRTAAARGLVAEALYFADHALGTGFAGMRAAARARLALRHGALLLRAAEPDVHHAVAVLTAAEPALSGSDVAACRTELARAQVLLGEPAEAVRLVGDALEVLDDHPRIEAARAHVVLGQARLLLHDQDAAVASCRTAALRLDLVGTSRAAAQTWRELGDLLDRAGDGPGMARAYQRALACAGLPPSPEGGALVTALRRTG